MARNEKKETVAARLRAYAVTFGCAGIIGGMGLGLVHQHNLHHSLAREDASLGEQIRNMNEKVQHALRVEAAAKSPQQLDARARALGLQLSPIQVTQRLYIVRTPGPIPLPVPAVRLMVDTNIPSQPAGGMVLSRLVESNASPVAASLPDAAVREVGRRPVAGAVAPRTPVKPLVTARR